MKDMIDMWMDEYVKAKVSMSHPIFRSSQVRDLTVIGLSAEFSIVVAVDSDGGIGPKPNDVVRVSGYEAGRFGARVPLMEILASGAVPIAAFDSLAVEMEPWGREIIRGVRDELNSIGLPAEFPLSGSTEDNVPTSQTGMGVVILGFIKTSDFRPGSSVNGDEIFAIGTPKSGPHDTIDLNDRDIADSTSVARILRVAGVHDVLPVGSKGIVHEVAELARLAGLQFVPRPSEGIDLKKSAGPSTCYLVSATAGSESMLALAAEKPVRSIGSLKA
jgi:selenophosphate synthetase-related protein